VTARRAWSGAVSAPAGPGWRRRLLRPARHQWPLGACSPRPRPSVSVPADPEFISIRSNGDE
ncbi:MAG: hypothetical protein U5L74_15465, partial [Ideonella sp.]|nr:hypothetical protein [Ideonella sp.]